MKKFLTLMLVVMLFVPALAMATETATVAIEELGMAFDAPVGYQYEVTDTEEALTITLTAPEDPKVYVLYLTLAPEGADIANLDQATAEELTSSFLEGAGLETTMHFSSIDDADGNPTALLMVSEDETVVVVLSYAQGYTVIACAASSEGVTDDDIQVLNTLTQTLSFGDVTAEDELPAEEDEPEE